jgi:hypothetical protein
MGRGKMLRQDNIIVPNSFETAVEARHLQERRDQPSTRCLVILVPFIRLTKEVKKGVLQSIRTHFYEIKSNPGNFERLWKLKGARSNVVVKALCYKLERRGIASRWGEFFVIYLILPAALWPWGRLSF